MSNQKATEVHVDIVKNNMTANGIPAPIMNGANTTNGVKHAKTNGHDPSNDAAGELVAPIDATEAYRHHPIAYELSKRPFLEPRKLKVIVAGAGASALSFAHEVETGNLRNIDLTILEKNAGLGGTWFENRYPGCACDIPAHAYLFTWAPNPNWSQYYVTSPEILDYMNDVADKYNLRKYITMSRKVVESRWLDDKQKWLITSRVTDGRRTAVSSYGVTDGEIGEDIVEECDIFINASGFFNHWRWPNTPGREKFKGQIVHSADYEVGLDLKGKRVAVIGNGSSGIQVTAAVQKYASSMSVYIRHPTWIFPNLGSKFVPNGENLEFSTDQKARWADHPEEYLEYRKAVETELNDGFPFFIHGTKHQAEAKAFTVQQMTQRLATKEGLAQKLIPDFPVGCRRPTPGTGYLEALCAENTEIVWGELGSFTSTGILSADGSSRDFDVIICATGFDMSFTPRWPIIGKNGIDLQKKWAQDPACYISAVANDMPNYFIYLGPGSPVGHGSLLPSIERVTGYISMMINKLQTQNYSSFLLKAGMAKAWQAHMFAWLEKTVWGDSCQSSFKNGTVDGKLHAFHPGSRLHYFELLRLARYEDFEWTSVCRDEPEMAFAWLANGFLEYELNNDGDKCWYMNHDTKTLTDFSKKEGLPQSSTNGSYHG